MLIPLVPLFLSLLVKLKNPVYPSHKPAFQPPGYIFGFVWTLLYLLFGMYLDILLSGGCEPHKSALLVLWMLNMVLNLSWSPLVFVHQRYVAGLYVSMGILFTLVSMLVLGESSVLKSLLVPYLMWMIFAILLNIEIINNENHKGCVVGYDSASVW